MRMQNWMFERYRSANNQKAGYPRSNNTRVASTYLLEVGHCQLAFTDAIRRQVSVDDDPTAHIVQRRHPCDRTRWLLLCIDDPEPSLDLPGAWQPGCGAIDGQKAKAVPPTDRSLGVEPLHQEAVDLNECAKVQLATGQGERRLGHHTRCYVDSLQDFEESIELGL